MRKINVLFMQSQAYFGADSMIHSLLMRYMDRSSFEVHAACNYGTKTRPSAALKVLQTIPNLHLRPVNFGISVHNRPRKEIVREMVPNAIGTLAGLSGLAAYIRKHKIDVIHCTEKPRDAFYGLLLAKATGARYVVHLHVKAENWLRPIVRLAMRHADALIGVSDFVSQSIVELGYPAEKTYSVLNSLDISRWNNQENGETDATGWNDRNTGATVRAEFGIPSDMPVMALVARICPWKGHGDLLRALAIVKEQQPRFRVLFVGIDDPRATPGGGSYTAELRALCKELNITEQVIFTGFRNDVPDVIAASDIYTMPSFEEPFGVVYLEAMAMRKPVVALDNGGAREIIQHGKSGLLSLPGDHATLAAHILTLLKDPQLRQQMGLHGRQQVEEQFTPQRMARDVEVLYRRLAGRQVGVPGQQGSVSYSKS
jgi:glycosyltransferase involved in cell wall biosynthesis